MLEVADEQITEGRAEELLRQILQAAWKGEAKRQEILFRTDRWNICCPYCGDSTDPGKKRGNFYPRTLTYKCYNAGCIYSEHKVFRDIVGMMQDFGIADDIDPMERAGLINHIRESRKNITVTYRGSNEDLITEDLKLKLVRREDFVKKMNLDEVIGTPMETYLRKRQQNPDKKFLADPRQNRIFILNMDPKGEYILGLQIRNFKYSRGNKYLSYRLSKIWKDFMGVEDEEFLASLEKIDPVSTLFGIFTSDLTRMFTIFEGPMDSFLFPNSVALCSLNNTFPFDLKNRRWFLDNDKAGTQKAMSLIQEGESVFLWTKFRKDNDISDKVKDLNALVIYLRSTDKKIKRLDNYFSDSKFDLIDI